MIPRRRYELPADLARLALRTAAAGAIAEGPAPELFAAALGRLLEVPGEPQPGLRLASSGRAALGLVLRALRVPRGAKVMVPAYTFAGVATLLEREGFEVVTCDVETERPVMSAATVASSWADGVACVLVTHLFGEVCDTGGIALLARARGAVVVEDCAHALGSVDRGRPVGRRGDGALFSFDVLKPVSAFGGGLAVLNRAGAELPEETAARPSPPQVLQRLAAAYAEGAVFRTPASWVASGALALPATRKLAFQAEALLGRREAPRTAISNLQALAGLRATGDLERRLARRRAMARRVLAALDLYDPGLDEDAPARKNAYFTVVRAARGERLLDLRLALLRRGIDAGLGAEVADHVRATRLANRQPSAEEWFARALQLPGGAAYEADEIDRLCDRLRPLRGRFVL